MVVSGLRRVLQLTEPESCEAGGEHEVDDKVQDGEHELEVAEHEGEEEREEVEFVAEQAEGPGIAVDLVALPGQVEKEDRLEEVQGGKQPGVLVEIMSLQTQLGDNVILDGKDGYQPK